MKYSRTKSSYSCAKINQIFALVYKVPKAVDKIRR